MGNFDGTSENGDYDAFLRQLGAGSPYEFEDYVAALYSGLGYSVEQTPKAADGGKDMILAREGRKYVVECKRYQKNSHVGRRDLQVLHSVMVTEKASGGIFVNTGQFSKPAHAFAKSLGIKLIDTTELYRLHREAFYAGSHSKDVEPPPPPLRPNRWAVQGTASLEHAGPVRVIAFSASGRYVAFSSEGGDSVSIWMTKPLSPIKTERIGHVVGLQFFGGDESLALISEKGIHIWNLHRRSVTSSAKVAGESMVLTAAAFMLDGSAFAYAWRSEAPGFYTSGLRICYLK